MLTEPFYWDLNEGTRAFSDRFARRFGGRKPTAAQAGVYAGVLLTTSRPWRPCTGPMTAAGSWRR